MAVTRMLTSPGPTGAKERSETVCRLSGAGMTAALKDDGTADIFFFNVCCNILLLKNATKECLTMERFFFFCNVVKKFSYSAVLSLGKPAFFRIRF